MFYSISELIIKCKECSLQSFNFEYYRYLKINLDVINYDIFLNADIFAQSFEDRKEKCSLCSKRTICKINKYIVEFAKIFIIVFQGNNYKNFSFSNNMKLSNNKNIVYNLSCFIEASTNLVYFNNNNIWTKISGYNKYEKIDTIENKKPVILFYQLNNSQGINFTSINQNMINPNQLNMNNINNPQNNINNNNKIPNKNINAMNNMGDNNNKVTNFNMNNNINNINMNNDKNPESLLKKLKETKEELNEQILKNKTLEEKIKELENELAKEKENKINIKNAINNADIIKRLELIEKENEMKKIISRYPFELLEGENILSVIFISTDQKIHLSIICKNTEKFSDVEARLYKVYPEYLESENYFLTKGKRVYRFKTIEQNNIKNSDIITLEKYE